MSAPVARIVVIAYGEERKSVLDDSTIQAIAAKHSKSAAQVMLQWHLQQGRSAIPKSTNPARIAKNFDVFAFTLTDDDAGTPGHARHRTSRRPRPR